jgi:hypothetical protein
MGKEQNKSNKMRKRKQKIRVNAIRNIRTEGGGGMVQSLKAVGELASNNNIQQFTMSH